MDAPQAVQQLTQGGPRGRLDLDLDMDLKRLTSFILVWWALPRRCCSSRRADRGGVWICAPAGSSCSRGSSRGETPACMHVQ